MEIIAVLQILSIVLTVIQVAGGITLIYLAIKLYVRYMKYLQVKTKYLEQKIDLK